MKVKLFPKRNAAILKRLKTHSHTNGMFHVPEAGHAILCGVVGCFRREKPRLREVGRPEQPQREPPKALTEGP